MITAEEAERRRLLDVAEGKCRHDRRGFSALGSGVKCQNCGYEVQYTGEFDEARKSWPGVDQWSEGNP